MFVRDIGSFRSKKQSTIPLKPFRLAPFLYHCFSNFFHAKNCFQVHLCCSRKHLFKLIFQFFDPINPKNSSQQAKSIFSSILMLNFLKEFCKIWIYARINSNQIAKHSSFFVFFVLFFNVGTP
jgi:hypothetical protein